MTITKTLDNETLTIQVEGEINSTNAVDLDQAITSSIKGVKTLILDFEKLDYISSAGLRIILSAQKKMDKQGHMKVLNCNETVMDVFDMTGFSNILDFGK